MPRRVAVFFLHSWVSDAAASGQSVVGRFEPVDCTGACCTKRHKIREIRLVLSEPVDPPWSLFFSIMSAFLELQVTPPAGYFVYLSCNPLSVSKGCHGHARQQKRCLAPVCSFREWKPNNERCGWVQIIWREKNPSPCRSRLAGYLARWGTTHLLHRQSENRHQMLSAGHVVGTLFDISGPKNVTVFWPQNRCHFSYPLHFLKGGF